MGKGEKRLATFSIKFHERSAVTSVADAGLLLNFGIFINTYQICFVLFEVLCVTTDLP